MIDPLSLKPEDITTRMELAKRQDEDFLRVLETSRKMYDLIWEPEDIDPTVEKAIDPTPADALDFVTDRICGQPPTITVPINHLLLEVPLDAGIDVDFSKLGLDPSFIPDGKLGEWLNKDSANRNFNSRVSAFVDDQLTDLARKRGEELAKALMGIEERNREEQAANLFAERVHYSLLDAQIVSRVQFNQNHGDDECPIVIQVLDGAFYHEIKKPGHQRECFYSIRRTKAEILEDWGIDLRTCEEDENGYYFDDEVEVTLVDYWYEGPKKKGKDRVVVHAFVLDGEYIIEPEITNYPSAPYFCTRVRDFANSEGKKIPRPFLRAFAHTWNAINRLDTRIATHLKQAVNADILWLSEVEKDENIGKGLGGIVQGEPGDKVDFIKPPDLGADFARYEQKLNLRSQTSLLPRSVTGQGVGTQSGLQVENLQQGAEVRFGSFIDAVTLHMGREYSFILKLIKANAKAIGDLEVWGQNPTGDPLTYSVAARDIGGDYRVVVQIDARSPQEKLREMLAMANLRQGPAPLLDDDTIRESLGWANTRDIRRRVNQQQIEQHADMVAFKTQEAIVNMGSKAVMGGINALVMQAAQATAQQMMMAMQQQQMGGPTGMAPQPGMAPPGATPGMAPPAVPPPVPAGPPSGPPPPMGPAMEPGGLRGIPPSVVPPQAFVRPGTVIGGADETPPEIRQALASLGQ